MIVENKGVISLEGKNGTGKSTFLKLLLGKANDVSYQGQFALTNGLKISYLPQDFTEYTGTLKAHFLQIIEQLFIWNLLFFRKLF